MRKAIVLLLVLASGVWGSKQDYPSRVDTGYVAAGKTWLGQAGSIFDLTAVTPDSILGAVLMPAGSTMTHAPGSTVTAAAIDVDTLQGPTRVQGTAAFTGPVTSALAPVFSGGATASSLNITGKTTLGDAAGDTTISKKTRAVSLHVGGTTDPDSTEQITGGLHTTGGGKIDGALNVGGVATFTSDLLPGTDNGPNIGSVAATVDTGFFQAIGIGTATAPRAPLEITGATVQYLSNPNIAHGMTAIAPTTVFGVMQAYVANQGGLTIRGLSDGDAATDPALALYGIHGHASPSQSAMHFNAGKANATDWQALAATEIGFQWTNYTTDLWKLFGNGRLSPAADGTITLGSTAASLDSAYIMDVVTGADIPWLDGASDVAKLRAIKPHPDGLKDARGRLLVDDNTLPKEIMLIYEEAGEHQVLTKRNIVDEQGDSVVVVDTTMVAHAAGDLILTASGSPMYSISPAIGQLQGAVRELAATDDSLRAATTDASFGGVPIGAVVAGLVVAVAGILAWNTTQKKQINALEARIAKLEGKEPSPPNPEA